MTVVVTGGAVRLVARTSYRMARPPVAVVGRCRQVSATVPRVSVVRTVSPLAALGASRATTAPMGWPPIATV